MECFFRCQSAYGTSSYLVTRSSCRGTYGRIRHLGRNSFKIGNLQVVSEAIKNLLSGIDSIVLQQEEELNLWKKFDKLEKKLQTQLNSLAEMEMKLGGIFASEQEETVLSPKHPLSVKRAKVDVLKKRVDDEKARYLNSVQVTQAMTLNNLKTSLPNIFQALICFSSAYTQSFEAIHGCAKQVDCHDISASPIS